MKAAAVNLRWYASTLAVADLFYWIFRVLWEDWEDNLPLHAAPAVHLHAARVTNAITAAIAAAALLMSGSNRLEKIQSRVRRAVLWPVLLIFLAVNAQYGYIHQKQAWLYIEDVGRTTIAGDRLLLAGANPYTSHLDRDGDRDYPGRGFGGYKYSPLMLASYLPWAVLCKDGDRAVLLANMCFTALAVAALWLCVAQWISRDAAILAAILFFIPRLITEQMMRKGGNDIVPMIPLMLALFFLERRYICGLLIGLAISTKLLPGLLWIPIGLTARKPGRYFSGMAMGLLPYLPFLIWNPVAIFRNLVLFNAVRKSDPAALLHGMPMPVWLAARLLIVAVYLLLIAHAWRNEIRPLRRCAWAIALAIGVQLAGPLLHQAYFLWWFVPLCAVTCAFLFNPAAYEWMMARRCAT